MRVRLIQTLRGKVFDQDTVGERRGSTFFLRVEGKSPDPESMKGLAPVFAVTYL